MPAFRGEGWSHARRNRILARVHEPQMLAAGTDRKWRYVVGGRSDSIAGGGGGGAAGVAVGPELAVNGNDISLTDNGDGTLSATAAVIIDDATVDVIFRSSSPGRITWPDGAETIFLGQQTIEQTIAVAAGDNAIDIVAGAISATVTVVRVSLTVSSPADFENAGALTFTITRSDGGSNVEFTAQTVAGTAFAGTDYTDTTETFTLTGSDSHDVTVPIADRSGAQGDRSFSMEVSA